MDLETIYNEQKNTLYDLTDVNVPEGKWYVSGIAWYEENNTRKVSWFKNGIHDSRMDFASNDTITNIPMHIYLYAASYKDFSKNTGHMAVDYVLVRKFVGKEPTVRVISTPGESKISLENVSQNEYGSSYEGNSQSRFKNESNSANNSENVSENNF